MLCLILEIFRQCVSAYRYNTTLVWSMANINGYQHQRDRWDLSSCPHVVNIVISCTKWNNIWISWKQCFVYWLIWHRFPLTKHPICPKKQHYSQQLTYYSIYSWRNDDEYWEVLSNGWKYGKRYKQHWLNSMCFRKHSGLWQLCVVGLLIYLI